MNEKQILKLEKQLKKMEEEFEDIASKVKRILPRRNSISGYETLFSILLYKRYNLFILENERNKSLIKRV